MNIAIIGAGFAGLSTAKILKSRGHVVTIYEKEPDVGGVWSASRRYPGLTTQNARATYAFSDFPYPDDYPEWPSGEQVQRYLENYARHFDFYQDIRLETLVMSAELNEAEQWAIASICSGVTTTETFDYLIVCNGIFSQPFIPNIEGVEAFVQQGGEILHTSELTCPEIANGKHVVVIGYGKSACDVAQAVSTRAASTTVVVRELLWKVPKKLMNLLNYKYLLLTRLGEGLFKYRELKGLERFLHGLGRPIRDAMLAQVEWIITKQLQLEALGLMPSKPFETIARSTVGLATDGFYKSVSSGQIQVKKGAAMQRIVSHTSPSEEEPLEGAAVAELSTGDRISVDLIICGTGWIQSVPFFSQNLNEQITDADGNFRLYRALLPIGVPNLAFNGYNSSFFSQLSCEIGALWIASLLSDRLSLPSQEHQQSIVETRLAWMQQFAEGKHAKGTNIIPFSLHHIDELLDDMGLSLPTFVRLKQWLLPVDPRDFAPFTAPLLSDSLSNEERR